MRASNQNSYTPASHETGDGEINTVTAICQEFAPQRVCPHCVGFLRWLYRPVLDQAAPAGPLHLFFKTSLIHTLHLVSFADSSPMMTMMYSH